MHLNEADLVDLADGTRSESSAPHLASCAACRQQLTELRATLAVAADVDVPEPSPLFWQHFSRRVHDAVGAAGRPRRSWLPWLVPAAALAGVLLVAIVSGWRPSPDEPARLAVAPPPPVVAPETLGELTDPSLTFVADLSEIVGSDAAGLSGRGSAEHAVTHLNEADLRALRTLLQAELAHASD